MIARILALIAVVGLVGGLIHLNSKQSAQLAEHEANLAMYNQLLIDMDAEQQEYLVRLEQRDASSTEYLSLIGELQREQADLTTALADGSKRLHINATCAPQTSGQKDSSSPSPHDGGVPRLNPAAEQDYLNLRRAYREEHRAFQDLQQHVQLNCK